MAQSKPQPPEEPPVNNFFNVETVEASDITDKDVQSFRDMMVDRNICSTLQEQGFNIPTPVQAKALPLLLLGTDMVVQAKPGTGKTLVFSILTAAMMHDVPKPPKAPLAIIMAPSREVAKQIYDTLLPFAPEAYTIGLFVGGVPYATDVCRLKNGCHIIVGSCGRVAQLVKDRLVDTSQMALFILDEADKLMDEEFVKEVNFVFSALPPSQVQVAVFSATYPRSLGSTLQTYMRTPTLLRISPEGEQCLASREYGVVCETMKKADALRYLLKVLEFNQCIVFANHEDTPYMIASFLENLKIECFELSGELSQRERFDVLQKLRENKVRIVVASDLAARGIDAPGVDLVINVGPAHDADTHMHRVGRAGRYGRPAVAISLLGNMPELRKQYQMNTQKNLTMKLLDLENDMPRNIVKNETFYEKSILLEEHRFLAEEVAARQKREAEMAAMKEAAAAAAASDAEAERKSLTEAGRKGKLFYTRSTMLEIRDYYSVEDWIEYSNGMEMRNVAHIQDDVVLNLRAMAI